MMIIGISLVGLGVSVLRITNVGTDPFSAMNIGFSQISGLSFGVAQLIVNIIIFIVQLKYSRDTIGLGTLLNLTLLAFISDFFLSLFQNFGWSSLNLIQRGIGLILAVLIISFGMSLYMTSGLGVAPYDSLGMFLPKVTKIPFRVWRVLTDGTCVVIAFFCKSTIGIGTLAIFLLTGPTVSMINNKFTVKFKEHLENLSLSRNQIHSN